MIKVGVIGFGKMGKIRAQAAKECGAEVVMVYDPEMQGECEFKVAKDAYEIIESKDIEAVFVCTPNFLNKKYTADSLKNNKHVFCEKPPALNTKEMREIIVAEKKYKKKLMYGLNHRHHESVMKMKEIVESGEYGKILWMRGRYGKNIDEAFLSNWRLKKELSGGGILIDQGIHMLDLFLYMCGDFDDVHAFVSNQYWKIDDVEDNVFAIFRNNSLGLTASLHSTMTQWRHLFSFEIFLQGGYMTLNGLKTPSGAYGEEILTLAKNESVKSTKRLYEKDLSFQIDKSWNNEVSCFFKYIQNNSEVKIGSSKDAQKLMKIIEKIYKSK